MRIKTSVTPALQPHARAFSGFPVRWSLGGPKQPKLQWPGLAYLNVMSHQGLGDMIPTVGMVIDCV